jgi:hypothetical protein
MLMGQ